MNNKRVTGADHTGFVCPGRTFGFMLSTEEDREVMWSHFSWEKSGCEWRHMFGVTMDTNEYPWEFL